MRWFGTDGIRDLAGRGRLDPGVVERFGRALVRFAAEGRREDGPVRLAVGRDPRPSGERIARALAAAAGAAGARVEDLGVVPTPVVAWATVARGLDAAVAVSASHNPPEYNGIKPFARGGRKLDPAEEARIEAWMGEADGNALSPETPLEARPAAPAYANATVALLEPHGRLDGMRLVVDLAAGAATATAPEVLRRLGAEVVLLHEAGRRPINDRCGTEHPEAWLARVLAENAAGLAFDGDADRVLLAAEDGEILDGDDALAILAADLLADGSVPGGCVVGTVMANLGLEERLGTMGVALERTAVGDRHVQVRMRETGAEVGAEPSGHVVLRRDGALIGDALVAGVRLLQAVRRSGSTLAETRAATLRYPQILRNVRLTERKPLEFVPAFQDALRSARERLGGQGRLVVRYSGTEPVLRVMAEGHDPDRVMDVVEGLVAAAEQTLA